MRRKGDHVTLKHTRWCLLKRPGNLTTKQAGRLRGLLRLNLRTARAYLLKEDFNHFWTYTSPIWAGKFLDRWCAMVMRSGIAPMKAKAKMLQSHRDLILNYFRAKKEYSSGVVEGLNTSRASPQPLRGRWTNPASYHPARVRGCCHVHRSSPGHVAPGAPPRLRQHPVQSTREHG